MKVVIADDEKLICHLIKSLIEWEDLNLEFSGFAHSGYELYDLVKKTNPDIIITDINMPELNGIELIRKLREENNEAKVIIITGYQDFEYAHSAIKYNVEDYHLKPVNRKDLNKSLEKLVKEITSQQANQFSNDLLLDSLKAEDLKTFIISKKPNWNTFNFFKVVVFKVFSNKHDFLATDKLSLANTFERIIAEKLKKENIDFIISQKDNITRLMVAQQNKTKALDKIIQEIYDSLDQYAKIFSGTKIYMYLSKGENNLPGLVDRFNEIDKLVATQLVNENQLITDYRLTGKNVKTSTIINAFNIIKTTIASNNLEDINTSISNLNYILPNPYDIYTIIEEFKKLFEFIFEEHYTLYGYTNNSTYTIKDFDKIIYTVNSYESLIIENKKIIMDVLKNINEYLQEKISLPIEKAIEFIYDNFNKSIYLDDVADHVKLTPSYFSSVFKDQTNKNFVEFLTDVRIEKGKEYLVTTNKTVKEISYLVGFSDSKYFSKVFRKDVGIRPSDYRRMFS